MRKSFAALGISLTLILLLEVVSYPRSFVQYGVASWYGPGWHGRRTSSGEIYNMYDYTAAHLTLPFGTQVIVTNMSNGKKVVVRINDRGPFKKGRIIDLSYAAAKRIDMIDKGTAYVKVELYKPPPGFKVVPEPRYYSVQVGAFSEMNNAKVWKGKIRGLIWWRIDIPLFIKREGDLHKVLVGKFKSEGEATKWRNFFTKRKIDSFVVAIYD